MEPINGTADHVFNANKIICSLNVTVFQKYVSENLMWKGDRMLHYVLSSHNKDIIIQKDMNHEFLF